MKNNDFGGRGEPGRAGSLRVSETLGFVPGNQKTRKGKDGILVCCRHYDLAPKHMVVGHHKCIDSLENERILCATDTTFQKKANDCKMKNVCSAQITICEKNDNVFKKLYVYETAIKKHEKETTTTNNTSGR